MESITANSGTRIAHRVLSTPYARRIAGERGIALAVLTGTGPNGRVTGADVLRFVPPTATAPTASAPAPSEAMLPSPAALAATVDLAAIRDLLDQFAGLAPKIALVDICLKAATAALRLTPGFSGGGTTIVLTAGRAGGRTLRGLDRLALGAIAAMRDGDATADSPDIRPALAVSWIGRAGIRPVAMPISTGGPARLVIAGDTAGARPSASSATIRNGSPTWRQRISFSPSRHSWRSR